MQKGLLPSLCCYPQCTCPTFRLLSITFSNEVFLKLSKNDKLKCPATVLFSSRTDQRKTVRILNFFRLLALSILREDVERKLSEARKEQFLGRNKDQLIKSISS